MNEMMEIDTHGQIIVRQSDKDVQQMGRSLLTLNDISMLITERIGDLVMDGYVHWDEQTETVDVN